VSHRTHILIALVGVAVVALAGAALATPPTGFTTNVLARGTAANLHARHDGIRVSRRHGGPADVAVATSQSTPEAPRDGITIPASSSSSSGPGR
jgi:hypothetical protein